MIPAEAIEVPSEALNIGMVFSQDLRDESGDLLIERGAVFSEPHRQILADHNVMIVKVFPASEVLRDDALAQFMARLFEDPDVREQIASEDHLIQLKQLFLRFHQGKTNDA